MKIESWNVHLFGPNRHVEAVKSRQDALVHLGIDLRSLALRPKLGKRLALEGSDHTLT